MKLQPIVLSLALLLLIPGIIQSMPALHGGPEPDYPQGVNQPDRRLPHRDDADLEGEWNILVILVDFPDYTWENQDDTLFNNEGNIYTPEHFEDMLFSDDEYAHPGSESDYTGSMRDFYSEISGGMFTVRGVITQWVRAPEPLSFYCNNDGEAGTEDDHGFGEYPNNVQRLVEDALALVDDDVHFEDFDNDEDGVVDALTLVHAGPGAEVFGQGGRGADYIWSHKWSIFPQERDGVTIFSYNMNPQDGTIGVFCHEFGHVLGLPDLYDVDYSSQGIGEWGLMAGGGWPNRPGDPAGSCPVHMCGWSKMQLGWVDVINVDETMEDVEITPVEEDAVIYRLAANGDEDSQEYFLVENRRQIGFDEGLVRRQILYDLPAPEGLLITHIDDEQADQGNYDETHRLVDVEEASPVWIGGRPVENLDLAVGDRRNLYRANRGDNGDLWPGFSEVDEDSIDWTGDRDRDMFGILTVPSSIGYDNTPTLVEVYDIRLDGENVIASFSVEAPDRALLYPSDRDFDDEDGGNGNGFIEPGETINLIVTLSNLGLRDALDITANLETESEFAEITGGQTEYPDIPADENAVPDNPFVIEISARAPVIGQIETTLNIFLDEELEFSYPILISLRPSREWFKHPDNPVLTGVVDTWDAAIMSPSVTVVNDILRCWYVGINPEFDPPNPGSVGFAWSADGGITWDRLDEPVLIPDEDLMNQGIGGIDVIQIEDFYLMMFVGSGIVEGDTTVAIYQAVSDDGIEWEYSREPAIIAERWASEIFPTQLGVAVLEDEIGCAFTAANMIGMPVIGAAFTGDLEDWNLDNSPAIEPTMNLDDYDGFAVLAPDISVDQNGVIVMFAGFTMDFVGRLGIRTTVDGENFVRHEGTETGGSILEPGGIGGWEGEDMLFGGRLFEWQGERRLLFSGVGQEQGSAAVGIALPEPVIQAVGDNDDPLAYLPGTVLLDPAFPNPFNSSTSIGYQLSSPGIVTITVYDIFGRKVTHHNEGFKRAGNYHFAWEGLTGQGSSAASGVYFVNISNGSGSARVKLLLIR